VLVTTGMLALAENEAQLAGVLAREVSLVSARVHEGEYRKARHSACRVALVGLYLVEAGGAQMPGNEEFIRNSRFAKTMKALGSTGKLDPEADAEYVSWFINRTLDMQKLSGLPRETSDAADKGAVELMAAAGYDPGEYSKLLAKLPASYSLLAHLPASSDRQQVVDKARPGASKAAELAAAPVSR
jgi:beta-barrel assembly-enhancing protease